jgi:hypothetical protein
MKPLAVMSTAAAVKLLHCVGCRTPGDLGSLPWRGAGTGAFDVGDQLLVETPLYPSWNPAEVARA